MVGYIGIALLLAFDEDTGLPGLLQKYFSFVILGLVLTVGYVFWRLTGSKITRHDKPREPSRESFQLAQKEIQTSKILTPPPQEEPMAHVEAAPSPPPKIPTDPAKRHPDQPPMEEA